MQKSVFLNSLYVKRWYIIGWALAMVLLTIFTVALFPTFKETFGESLKDVPESAKAFMGDSASWTTLSGFVNLQIFEQFIFMTIIMVVILGAALLAGDESNGSLQSLLAQPVSRTKVYWQKYLGLLVASIIGVLAVVLSVFVVNLFLKEPLDVGRVSLATLSMIIVTHVFGTLTYALGAIIGKKGLSGSVVGFFAFTTYLITAIATNIQSDIVKFLDKLSPFHYYNKPNIMENGLNLSDNLLLVLVIIVVSIIGWQIFKKRDIPLP